MGKIIRIPSYLVWLFPYKRKGMSVVTESTLAYYLFQNKISIIFINWAFQGMRGMGRADIIGKIVLELILAALIFTLLNGHVAYVTIIALIISHTLNWLLNSHFWDTGRFLGITRTAPDRFFPYIRSVVDRINRDSSSAIPAAIIIGGLSRNREFTATSDVDMILIRGSGMCNAVSAVLAAMRERAIAFFCKFPLHLELYDDIDAMKIHRIDEVPVILRDEGNLASGWYRQAGREISVLEDYDCEE